MEERRDGEGDPTPHELPDPGTAPRPPEQDAEDKALLKAWSHGDESAGDRLFRRYQPSVARFFRGKTNEAAREDLIQETFLSCMRSAAGFRGESRFLVFLLAIARNVLRNHARALGRRNKRFDPEVDLHESSTLSPEPSPLVMVMTRDEQRRLREALRRIPVNHQIALELYYWEELTTTEIGAVLQIPLGTVRTRLRDGRAHLEEQLATNHQLAGAGESTPRGSSNRNLLNEAHSHGKLSTNIR